MYSNFSELPRDKGKIFIHRNKVKILLQLVEISIEVGSIENFDKMVSDAKSIVCSIVPGLKQ